ncbi:MAG TPA: hypothetical protein VJO72_08785, partial [Candidatus Dormibacteraeota bacterium]|nr:hypothetical protein [Candidatus Dormibacteraeota bacterium]
SAHIITSLPHPIISRSTGLFEGGKEDLTDEFTLGDPRLPGNRVQPPVQLFRQDHLDFLSARPRIAQSGLPPFRHTLLPSGVLF